MDERAESAGPDHFITQRIRKDLEQGKHGGAVVTRFPSTLPTHGPSTD